MNYFSEQLDATNIKNKQRPSKINDKRLEISEYK